ncbi:MAG: DNA adenine methylase [Ruminococcus sp.]|nr:DNA adenine methylase [Ruminococcus sp.]
MKNYGMPYKGSKNMIAEKIISLLPEADCFVDLFGGGGAMSHCAVLSGKYRKVIYNEIESLVYKGFVMALNGAFRNERRWISREEFFRLKDSDPYVAMCFSFGNDLRSYAYSPENERLKKHIHEVFFAETPVQAYLNWKKFLNDYRTIDYSKKFKLLHNLDCLKRLQSLERFYRLKNISDLDIECHNLSYEQVKIPENSVVYCDIPYRNTEGYTSEFDYKKFYLWAKSQPFTVYISEYSMPDEFHEIANITKRCTLGTDNSKKTVEKIFVSRLK